MFLLVSCKFKNCQNATFLLKNVFYYKCQKIREITAGHLSIGLGLSPQSFLMFVVIYLLSSWSILIFGKLFFICFCPFPSIIPLDRGWGRGFGCRRFSVSGFSLGWAWGRSPFAAIFGTIFPSRPIKIRSFSITTKVEFTQAHLFPAKHFAIWSKSLLLSRSQGYYARSCLSLNHH